MCSAALDAPTPHGTSTAHRTQSRTLTRPQTTHTHTHTQTPDREPLVHTHVLATSDVRRRRRRQRNDAESYLVAVRSSGCAVVHRSHERTYTRRERRGYIGPLCVSRNAVHRSVGCCSLFGFCRQEGRIFRARSQHTRSAAALRTDSTQSTGKTSTQVRTQS